MKTNEWLSPPFFWKTSLLVFILSLNWRKISWFHSSDSVPPAENPSPINYIVRFKEYKSFAEHRDYLRGKIRSVEWEWIERNNPAMQYPTDFAVVAIRNSAKQSVIEELKKLDTVKDVNLEFTYRREILAKRPGKVFTSMSFEDSSIHFDHRRLMQKYQITSMFGADALWRKGYTGARVKMAIFDTGIRVDHPHFRNIKERTNWTNEDSLNDNLGHGTFVAGVIAGQDSECYGFAPDAEIHAFRVFTDAQVSYTSWFLDAFNYAIATEMDVLNLSIGGPDYLDLPFVEKVWEITSNNIIMVSAIGNDGPLYGTLNNPADQTDVIGVGGIDYNDHIAVFSSRGMTTWELPHGYGRVKPDVVAYGREIMGSKITTGCKTLSGTSVASPVVAGVVCLLMSVLPEDARKRVLNPASMKQALVEGAAKLSGPNMFEQGAGRVDLLESYEVLKNYQPRASVFPGTLDFTDCPYMWPFCRQPLYAGAMPVIFNASILNGMGVVGYIEKSPVWQPANEDGNLLSIRFTYSDILWPWTGYLALHIQVRDEGSQFTGVIEGNVSVTVYSPPARGEKVSRRSECVLRLKVSVIPTPSRSKRILWDQFHSIKYPPGYIPRDSLDVRNDILDWHGDHLHTNFHIMFNMLRDAGYFIESLGSPFTCFNANSYGTLLLIDLEEEFFDEEIEKLKDDVITSGLGLVVFADWYNVDTMVKMRFFDDNTRSWWTPVTGGANIPALNDLLSSFGISFGDRILNGDFVIDGEQSRYASGTDITRFPKGGFLHSVSLLDSAETGTGGGGVNKADSNILGFVDVGKGKVAVYGDSNCLDSSHMVTNCFSLLKKILRFTMEGEMDTVFFSPSVKLETPLFVSELPLRRTDVNFTIYSSVVGKELVCRSDSRFEVWGTKGYNIHVRGRNKRLPGYPVMDLGDAGNSSVRSTMQWKKQTNDVVWGMLNGDEDLTVLVSTHHLVAAAVVVIGFLLLMCVWRIRQRRRRKKRGRIA